MTFIEKIASYRNKRTKKNTQKWFDGEVLEKLNARDRLFKKFKKSRLHMDKQLLKKAKYDTSKLITTKKQEFFKERLSETIGKPEELWESLKSLGMSNKTLISNFNATEQNNTLTHDTRSISQIFKNLFSNLVESLLIKLPKPPDKCNFKSVIQYYSSFAITADFCVVRPTEKQALNIMQDIKSSKAA